MPGGIAPVDRQCAEALCRARRQVRLPASADESRIFYNLTMDRVHYFPRRNAIYFVDSSYASVPEIIRGLLRNMNAEANIEQLHLDRWGIVQQAKTVLVALRLHGIQVAVSE